MPEYKKLLPESLSIQEHQIADLFLGSTKMESRNGHVKGPPHQTPTFSNIHYQQSFQNNFTVGINAIK